MWIPSLNLTNFRNYRHLELSLPSDMVVIHGDNAQGKTNLLEAIYVLATTKSHRTSGDRELIHQLVLEEENVAIARLFAEARRARGDITIEIALKIEDANPINRGNIPASTGSMSAPVHKRIRVNGIARRAVDVVGQVNVVMFCAQDIDLIIGTPNLCRRYLDLVNSQTDSRYLRALQRYQRVLVQRNHLLRLLQEDQAHPEQLEFWDNELVQNGSYILQQRWQLIADLNDLSRSIHQELCGGMESLEIVYLPSFGNERDRIDEIELQFRQTLNQLRRREISQGMTLAGPHRDNLRFLVNNTDMSKYGSRGQQRTVALSLKLAEAKYMNSRMKDSPILLLDDVLSELDRGRRQHLLKSLSPFQQVLISTAELDYLEPSFLHQSTRFHVKQGTIEVKG